MRGATRFNGKHYAGRNCYNKQTFKRYGRRSGRMSSSALCGGSVLVVGAVEGGKGVAACTCQEMIVYFADIVRLGRVFS